MTPVVTTDEDETIDAGFDEERLAFLGLMAVIVFLNLEYFKYFFACVAWFGLAGDNDCHSDNDKRFGHPRMKCDGVHGQEVGEN